MRTEAIAYPRSWRVVAAVLVAVSRGSLLAIVVLLLFPDAGPDIASRLDNPLRLMRVFTTLSLVPGIAAWLLERAFAVNPTVRDGALVLQRRRQRIEIPCEAIDDVLPWMIPLPAGGLCLRLSSGRLFDYGLQVGDPIALADALADAGAPERIRRVSEAPAAIYARSRPNGSRRWYHPVLEFIVYALVPALPVFRVHQWIAYGDTFGEYYTYGLEAYLIAFGIYWGTAIVYLVLWAALVRAIVETAVVVAAWLVPARTPRVRRAAETLDRILYYGSVPLFLVRLFLRS